MLILYCENLVTDTKKFGGILFGDICSTWPFDRLVLCVSSNPEEGFGARYQPLGPGMPTDSDKI